MKKFGYCFFVFAVGLFFLPLFALAEGEVARLKIISTPQTIEAGALSGIFTIESQDVSEIKTNVSTTTVVNLSSSSATGKFAASSAGGPCGSLWTINSVTIAKNTSHKSFCYKDETPGSYFITVSALSQSAILPDSQNISIIEPVSSATTTTPQNTASSSPNISSSTQESLIQSLKVKIFSFMPNPSGDDPGKEWVEIKNLDEKDVLLDGWLLDDKNTGDGPAVDALVLSGVIVPGEIKRFILPAGSFVLNNSNGDEINLYFSDKSLADKAVYAQVAYDDGIFELREGIWQQPTRNSGSSGGGAAAANFTYAATVDFKLNEILPNPSGDDSGKEWVEIFNPTNATATLENYFLANGSSDSFSPSAWVIPRGELIPPLGLIAVVLPKNAFVLSNQNKEKVKLFSPQKQLLDSVIYENAPENKSWAKDTQGKWGWSIPSFGKPNNQTPEILKVFISEILPWPENNEEEFIEITSFATTTIDLEGSVLRIGNREKTFEANAKIDPNGYFVIFEDDLPTRLRNSGQTVKLLDVFGRIAAETVFPKAQAGKAFASLDGKNYVWTSTLTPGEENKLVLGETIASQGQAEDLTKVSVDKKIVAAGATTAQINKLLASNEEMRIQLAQTQESIDQLQETLASQNQLKETLKNQSLVPVEAQDKLFNFYRIAVWGFGILFLAGIIVAFFKYVKL